MSKPESKTKSKPKIKITETPLILDLKKIVLAYAIPLGKFDQITLNNAPKKLRDELREELRLILDIKETPSFNDVIVYNNIIKPYFKGYEKVISDTFARNFAILKDLDRKNALLKSVEGGSLTLFKYFLRVEEYDEDESRFLEIACKKGYQDIADYIIQLHEQDTNAHRRFVHELIRDALDWSAEGGQVELMKHFIEMGANNWFHALNYAVKKENNIDVMDLILEHSNRSGSLNADLDTAVGIATIYSNFINVKYLMQKGAHFERVIKAAGENRDDLIDYLVDEKLVTPNEMVREIIKYDDLNLVLYLINNKNAEPTEAFYFALRYGKKSIANYLFKTRDIDFEKGLQLAKTRFDYNMIEKFEKRDFDFD